MGAQAILQPGIGDVCRRVDEWLVCQADAYMTYKRYLVGSLPDMERLWRVAKVAPILCGRGCGLCPDEIGLLKEQLHKLIA